jgi:hypothetical protein
MQITLDQQLLQFIAFYCKNHAIYKSIEYTRSQLHSDQEMQQLSQHLFYELLQL